MVIYTQASRGTAAVYIQECRQGYKIDQSKAGLQMKNMSQSQTPCNPQQMMLTRIRR